MNQLASPGPGHSSGACLKWEFSAYSGLGASIGSIHVNAIPRQIPSRSVQINAGWCCQGIFSVTPESADQFLYRIGGALHTGILVRGGGE